MKLEKNFYYHLYNRTNNREIAFHDQNQYLFFLKKYRKYCSEFVDTLAYCIMPTHFHLLVYIKDNYTIQLNKNIGIWLSSFAKAINKSTNRHGSLFQQHTKAKHIDNENYLLTVMTYIHQNPLRHKLINKLEDWPYSSYLDLVNKRTGTLPNKEIILDIFNTIEEFEDFSKIMIKQIDPKYWI